MEPGRGLCQAGWRLHHPLLTLAQRPARLCPKKGVWNSPASINAGEFQTPFFGQSRPLTEGRNDGGRTGAPQSSQRSRSRQTRVPWQLCPVPGTPKARLPAMAGSCTRRNRDLKARCTLIASCPQGMFHLCCVHCEQQWSCGKSGRARRGIGFQSCRTRHDRIGILSHDHSGWPSAASLFATLLELLFQVVHLRVHIEACRPAS